MTDLNAALDEMLKRDSPLAPPKAPVEASPAEPLAFAPSGTSTRNPMDQMLAGVRSGGFSLEPPAEPPSSDEGFWSLAGRSLVQGAVMAGHEVASGAAAAVPTAVGGSTVAQQAAQLPEPDAADEIQRLNKIPITEADAWTNPRWWGVKLGLNIGGAAPVAGLGIGGSLAGGAVAGPLGALTGGAAGAAGGMALQTLVPAYQAARARGLDHDAALDEALLQTGIAGSFGAAMGIVGGTPMFGTTITGALRRPITEALTKLGLVEPGLMVTQQAVQKAAGPGGWITPDEALEGYIFGATVGAGLHGVSEAMRPVKDILKAPSGPITDEGIKKAFETTQGRGASSATSVEPGVTPDWPGIHPEFYDKVGAAIAGHSSDSMEPHEWHSLMTAAHPDMKELPLPFYLADNNGKVSKTDLLAYVEGQGVVAKESVIGGPDERGLYLTGPDPSKKPFAGIEYQLVGDRDGNRVLSVKSLTLDNSQLGKLRSDPLDLMAQAIAERAASLSADRILWGSPDMDKAFNRLAQMHGMSKGITRAAGSTLDANYININPVIASNIRQGQTLFSRKPGTYLELHASENAAAVGTPAQAKQRVFPKPHPKLLTGADLKPSGELIVKIIESLRKAMGMKAPLTVHVHEGTSPRRLFGLLERDATGYRIGLWLGEHTESGAEGLFATAAHEFGHAVMFHFFDRSPVQLKAQIANAFLKWRRELPPNSVTLNQLGVLRDNAVSQYYGGQWHTNDKPLNSLTPERQRYWSGFEEWFAEQIARYMETEAKPQGMIERFFSSLGRRIVKVINDFKQRLPEDVKEAGFKRPISEAQATLPVPEVKAWMDSLINTSAPFAADIYAAAQLRSIRANQSALNKAGEGEVNAVPETASTGAGRNLLRSLFGLGMRNPEVPAGADRFNKFYEWMISMPQLAKLNPGIDGLQRYRELNNMLHLEKNQMMVQAENTLRLWRALMTRQADAVAGFIDDYMNMTYRTPDEVKKRVRRMPTEAEFEAMVRKHGVSDKGLAVFQRVVKDFDQMLERYRMLLEQGAHEIEDPVVSAQKLKDVADQIAALRKAPYFPAMRFGNYTLTVWDKANSVAHFETFESQRALDGAAEEAAKSFPADHRIRKGYLKKDVAPLVGMPPGLLDKIAEKLDLSRTQREAIDELKFEYMPAQSFAHRFRQKKMVAGYSQDFLRAYASYMFHGANYFTRAKYVDSLRDAVDDVRKVSAGLDNGVKRDQIANYLNEHLGMLLDPKPDFANLRSIMFHWALGFSPAAATINLSQTILGTYPYLASKFGNDLRAVAAMANASRKLSTFYTKDRLEGTTDPELKGISEAVRQGIISETQANVLAATAEGRVLSQGFGGNRAEKAFNMFSRASQFFFEMTEQTNRRVAFRAAWDMAMSDPSNPHVGQMVRENQLLFESLRLKGFTEQEARAFVTAKDAVDSTQYIYAPYARPKFMTSGPLGRLGKTIFMFKSFTQNTLFYLWNNPGAAMRSLFILGAAGGLMGLPGSEDINGILRAVAFHLFGKDFDIQDQVRQFVIDVLEGGGQVDRPGALTGERGIRPDILLHGMSRVGYGIPAVMDMMGSLMGMGHIPMPVTDRHMNIGMGNILPIEPGQFLAPQITGPGAGGHNYDSAALQQVQRASGAVFGVGFSLYKALEAFQSPSDLKRWEAVMPTALRNASQAFRFANEGKARNAQGAALVRFDPHEPEQAMEILGQALGYRPARLSEAWDRRTAEKEAEAFWDIRRSYLMQSAWTAKQSGDNQAFQSVVASIKSFNKMLPDDAKGKAITGDGLRQNFEQRARATVATETGVPKNRGNIPLSRTVQRLYPESKPAGRAQGGALGK